MPDLNRVFYLTVGDTGPALDAIIYKADGVTPWDLTGASVTFDMDDDEGNPIITGGAVTITAPTLGKVSYSAWTGFTGTAGRFWGRFKVTLGGVIMSAPNDARFLVLISS